MSTRTGDYVFVTDGPFHARVGRVLRWDVTNPKKPAPVVALFRSKSLPAATVTVALRDTLVLAHAWAKTARALPDEATLLAMYADGVTSEDIAAMYGVKRFSVYKAFNRMGLPGGPETRLDSHQGDRLRNTTVPALQPRRGDTMNVGCLVLVTDGEHAERPGKLVGWDLIDGRLAPVVDLLPIRRLAARRVTLTESQMRVLLRSWPGAKIKEPTQDTLRRLINAGYANREIAARYRMPLWKVQHRVSTLRGVAGPGRTARHTFPIAEQVRPVHKQTSTWRKLQSVAAAARGTGSTDHGFTKAGMTWLRGLHFAGLAITYHPEDGWGTRKARKSDTVKRFRVEGRGQVDVRFAA